MSKRSYNQFCPLAYSLDVIGERWTLLIIRELLLGPRRYTDLLNGLPGIGTNLLASRLKSLEEMNVIQQRTLPPPSASQVYELTEFGDGLRPVIGAISNWGMNFMQFPPPEDDFVGVVPSIAALRSFFKPDAAQGIHASYEFRMDDTTLALTINEGELTLVEGSANNAPDMIVQTTRHVLISLIGGEQPVHEAIKAGQFNIIKGDLPLFEKLIPVFAHVPV
ncbi:MAG: helix-turn-helix domain-containing protein [Aggregatilineales bacterium]